MNVDDDDEVFLPTIFQIRNMIVDDYLFFLSLSFLFAPLLFYCF